LRVNSWDVADARVWHITKKVCTTHPPRCPSPPSPTPLPASSWSGVGGHGGGVRLRIGRRRGRTCLYYMWTSVCGASGSSAFAGSCTHLATLAWARSAGRSHFFSFMGRAGPLRRRAWWRGLRGSGAGPSRWRRRLGLQAPLRPRLHLGSLLLEGEARP